MMRNNVLVLSLVLAFAATGCVGKGTHQALQKQFDQSQANLTERDDQLAKEQAKSAQLQEKIEALEAELNARRAELAAANNAKAAMLKDKKGLEASIDEMRLALADLSRRKAAADARIAEFRSLIDRFKSLIDAGKLQVKMVDGRMVVALASDVLFASGQAKLSKDGQAAIIEVAALLAGIPDRKFQVEGHTDNVPIATAAYPSNWELAAGRAITVVKTMIDAGMAPSRISAASLGDSRPAVANDSPEHKAINRRIEIVVVPDLSALPGFEELQQASN